jgi:hypothetical protein
VLRDPHERRQELERRLEHDRRHRGADDDLAPGEIVVREDDVRRREEDEDADDRDADRNGVREHGVVAEPGVALEDLGADRPDDE